MAAEYVFNPKAFADVFARQQPDKPRIDDRPALAMELTDEQLRAECLRRFPQGFGQVHETTLLERAQLKADYEGACRLVAEMHAAAVGGRVGDGPRLGVLEDVQALARERDEWKRRAQVAEGKLTNPYEVLRIKTDDGDLVPLGHVQDCGRIEIVVTRVDDERLPMRDLLLSGVESGHGIEGRPAAERSGTVDLATLADLLADDAP